MQNLSGSLPPVPPGHAPTSAAEQDAAIATLRAASERWRAATLAEQVELLEALIPTVMAASEGWVGGGPAR